MRRITTRLFRSVLLLVEHSLPDARREAPTEAAMRGLNDPRLQRMIGIMFISGGGVVLIILGTAGLRVAQAGLPDWNWKAGSTKSLVAADNIV